MCGGHIGDDAECAPHGTVMDAGTGEGFVTRLALAPSKACLAAPPRTTRSAWVVTYWLAGESGPAWSRCLDLHRAGGCEGWRQQWVLNEGTEEEGASGQEGLPMRRSELPGSCSAGKDGGTRREWDTRGRQTARSVGVVSGIDGDWTFDKLAPRPMRPTQA